MKLNRRQFMKGASASAALASTHVLGLAAKRAQAATGSGKYMVIVQMEGGNDPLNTLIPLNDGAATQRTIYDDLRPSIGIPTSSLGATTVAPDPLIGNEQALHFELSGLKQLYDENKLAIIPGVGYPSSSLSHFEAEAVWFAGEAPPQGSGWAGRFMDAEVVPDTPHGISFGSSVNPTLAGLVSDSLGIRSITRFDLPDDGDYRDVENRIPAWAASFNETYAPGSLMEKVGRSGRNVIEKSELFNTIEVDGWGSNLEGIGGISSQFQQVSSILRHDQINVGTPTNQTGLCVFHVRMGGFDTHSEQGSTDPNSRYASLMRELNDGMTGFQRDLEGLSLEGEVCTVTYSEFGRRIFQNDSGNTAGTDHGISGIMFVMGDSTFLDGGVKTSVPDLATANSGGNIEINTDFRQVYASIIEDFLGGNQNDVFSQSHTKLPLFLP